MDFRKMSLKSALPVLLIGFLLIGLLFWKLFFKTDSPSLADNVTLNPIQNTQINGTVGSDAVHSPETLPQMLNEPAAVSSNEDDAAIQEQIDSDRRQQKVTRDLKNKLEQIDLELDQAKAQAEINKLKKDNSGLSNEPAVDGQNTLPDIKVDYIGGDSAKKEAILSIAGVTYQVKEKSNPTDNIQVVTISDSSVTVHITAPQDLIKTIDYKSE